MSDDRHRHIVFYCWKPLFILWQINKNKFFLKYMHCPQIVWLRRRLLLLLLYLLLPNTDHPQQLEDNVKGYTWKMVKTTVELGCLEYHGSFKLFSCSR
jgi:hypothetical protein